MNLLQECKQELARLGQALTEKLTLEAHTCQCEMQEVQAASDDLMCGCGQNACQIGDGPNACKPHQRISIEQIEGA